MDFKIKISCPECAGVGEVFVVNHDALRQRREYRGVSLRKMADKLGVTPPYLSDIERGNRRCTEKIEKAYRKLLK